MDGRHWLSRLFRAISRDQSGNAAVVFCFCAVPLAAGAGLAIDTMLAYSVEDQLQKSLDAAGLAAGRTASPEDVEADARSYFNTNFDAGTGFARLDDFDVVVNEVGDELTLTASAQMQTRFMRLFGKDTVNVAARTVINRQTRGMELALVLDNTGSMVDDNKIGGLKTAAHDLMTILYGDKNTARDLWVAVVPYIAAVNVGTGNKSFLAASDRVNTKPGDFSPDSWEGCVLARATPRDQNDDPPSAAPFASYLYPDVTSPSTTGWQNDWGTGRSPKTRKYVTSKSGVEYWEGYGPNVGCPSAITPLVPEKSKITAAIDAQRPWYRGGTIISEGLVWGWRVLSPRWRGLWSGADATMPLDYANADTDKVIVLLTDGDNQMLVQQDSNKLVSPYTAYETHTKLGVTITDKNKGTEATNAAKTLLDTKTTNICTAIKNRGVLIYTISFGSSPSTAGQALLRSCATRPEFYFHSPNSSALRTAFRTIGGQLSNLRIAQ